MFFLSEEGFNHDLKGRAESIRKGILVDPNYENSPDDLSQSVCSLYDWTWWLRTSASDGDTEIKAVGENGHLYQMDARNDEVGVRPALWISLD